MNIAVIGTGYVGLVTGTCLAETGNNVVCVDIDEEKIATMQQGKLPIYEPHLDVFFTRNIKAKRLSFTNSLEEGVIKAQIIFLALPTPQGEDGSAELDSIFKVTTEIGKVIKDYKIIVNKSTVPVGTCARVANLLQQHTDTPFDVVSNPEFLKEGVAVDDFMKPDRIVIGSNSEKATQIMKELYKPYVRSGNPILLMNPESSELTKYATNAFLATKITFMNEIANYCEKVGADVDQIRQGMGTDTRIGKRFLFSGIGYGGSCFPKDVNALYKAGKQISFDFKILQSVIQVNEKQKTILIPYIKNHLKNIRGKKIAIWGLAFKPETDDIREAPALYIIDQLLSLGADIHTFDPEAMNNVKNIYGDKISYGENMYSILEDANSLIICTEWNIFRTPNFNKIKDTMKQPFIFDGRNLYNKQKLRSLGFTYKSIGR